MRRKLLFFLVLIFVITLDGKIIFKMQWYPQAQFAGYIMAKEKGFFEQENLDVELLFSDGSTILLDELSNDEIQYCSAWLSEVVSKNHEKQFINIAQILQRSSLLIVAKKENGILHPHDLNGKRLSLWGGNFTVPLEAFLQKYSIDYDKIPSSYNIDLFLSGACDASSVMYYNEYYKIYLAGIDFDELTTFSFADDPNLNFPEDGIYVTKDYYQHNKQECKQMRTAILRGWQYAKTNKEETLQTILRYAEEKKMRTNYSQQKWMLESILRSISNNGKFKMQNWGVLQPAGYQRVNKVLIRDGIIQDSVPYNEFYKGESDE